MSSTENKSGLCSLVYKSGSTSNRVTPPEATGSRLNGGERWYLVHTLPRGETRAQMHLGAQGFRNYCPQLFRTVRHARKLRTVRVPFFPRYLFIVLDLNRDRSVRSTVGVSDLVSSKHRPIAVEPGIVEELIGRSDESGLLFPVGELSKGQRVQILSGPLSGLIGTLERLDDNGRVRVLLEIMHTPVPVGIERFRLLPV